jgi:hypothetical protein
VVWLSVGILIAVLIRDFGISVQMDANFLSLAQGWHCDGVAIAACDCVAIFHWLVGWLVGWFVNVLRLLDGR